MTGKAKPSGGEKNQKVVKKTNSAKNKRKLSGINGQKAQKLVKKTTTLSKNNRDLTMREQLALMYYIQNKHTDMTGACIKAGYSCKSAHNQGSKLLQNPLSDMFLATYTENALEKCSKTAIDVLEETVGIAFNDIANYFEDDGHGGIQLKNILTMGAPSKNIKKIKHECREVFDKGGEVVAKVHKYEYEMYDKLKALELLGKYYELYNNIRRHGDDEKDNTESGIRIYLPENGRTGKAVVAVEYDD